MHITWLGHACFLLEQDGYRIILDPYTDVPGYPPLEAEAHAAFCSHHHFDHDYLQAVQLLPERESPFRVRTVETFHDDQGGVLRGRNTIHVFTADDTAVAHLGDLGHQLTAKQVEEIGPLDGVLVPVGGVYTLDAAGAKQVCHVLNPKWVIPMHYHHAPYGLSNVGSVEDFLRLWPAGEIHHLPGNEISVTPETAGVLVPEFLKMLDK
ncbi:L-ascorbate metabolism protein UlaG, beta-lactamase superfamily [Oscillibacter sp. PC13]|uniref:MBL fold metallo-hydrolase n=1 Tax=Oscillibacter sp. PC13 TaxID=1855299 RepID=UPI0008EAC349|nr:MBL fold metallo-hydrolase [Oscillibacter sp. PC13]SFP33833.1 L-ascorbate metabolism protein UlaG, beta-lactamase superfamily [Oscillibacter sp. PC13]